jgi:hypothetical protein
VIDSSGVGILDYDGADLFAPKRIVWCKIVRDPVRVEWMGALWKLA